MLPVIAVALLLARHVRGSHTDPSWSDHYFGNSTGWASNYSTISTSWSTSSTTVNPESPPFSTTSPTSWSTSSTTVNPESPPFSTTSPTSESACSGSVTYIGSVYPTVYVTVTEGYQVTIMSSNASYPASETLITPLPACQSTIVPNNSTSIGTEASQNLTAGSFLPPIPTSLAQGNQSFSSTLVGGGRPPPHGPSPPEAASSESILPISSNGQTAPNAETLTSGPSPVYSSVPYTSTVTVTKKVPVSTVAPPPSKPPPVFTRPPTRPPTQSSNKAPSTTPPKSQSSNPSEATPSSQQNKPSESASSRQSNNPGDDSPTQSSLSDEAANGDSHATSASPSTVTAGPGAIPSSPVTRVNNVPISVGASSIIVGTQAIAIPTTGAVTVRAGSQLFTVEPSSLLASGTTVALGPLQHASGASPAPPTTITAAPGVVITVQGTTAVIAGTTYRIGSGAIPTTISVSGQRIQLGPSGVVLASTTIPASYGSQGSGLVVESYDGLTFSVGATAAVIDGTTYAIGSGAPITHTTIHGQSVSFGPGGVGVEGKTTLKPTTVAITSGSATAAGKAHSSTHGSTGSRSRSRTSSAAAAITSSVQNNAGAVALGLRGKSVTFIDIIFSHWPLLLLAVLGSLG